MLPLSALALYNVLVRVDQYGWTVSRVWAACAATWIVIYSVGYLLAAIRPARFQAGLAGTNYAAVFFAIVILTAFNTPILDPRRVAADSQTARLLDGRLGLAKFDFNLMTSDADQFGRARLQQLAEGAGDGRDPQIAAFAKRAIAGEYISTARGTADTRPMPEFIVYPAGRTVPAQWWASVSEGYLRNDRQCTQDVSQNGGASASSPCAVIFADLSGTGQDDLVLYVPRRDEKGHHRDETFTVFVQTANKWTLDQTLSRKDEFVNVPSKTENGPAAVEPGIGEDIARGAVSTVRRKDRDLVIGGVRLGRQ